MPALAAPRPSYDPWRDAHGTPVPFQCRIEQVAVDKNHGALPCRLHQQGQVLGRGTTRLSVRCDGETTMIGIRPHLVRVLTTPNEDSRPTAAPMPRAPHPR